MTVDINISIKRTFKICLMVASKFWVLSFTGRKKQKVWNKTREKYMPVKRRQYLAETDGIILQREMVRRIFRQ